ncbi:MAG: helix-turn-helix domain-containing protein [Candidatus Omnitrophota bacterium]|nr:helix-turn-helix domain-containing protein [Candidatus Omnitrophota bacterium]
MITILITEDEVKTKEALAKMLAQEGYVLSANTGQNDVIRVVKKDCIRDLAFIKDRVVELENSLFIEKRGILYKSVLEAVEKPLLEQTLERCEGNQLKAARILGINRNTMRAKIKKLGIDASSWKVNT